MGGSFSGLSRQLPEGTRRLTLEEKQALEAFLTLRNTQEKDGSFTEYLLQYLTAATATSKSKSNSPARRLGLLLSDDKHVRADSVFALARLGADTQSAGTLRHFIESVCVSGLKQFWRGLTASPEAASSVRLDGWVVEWVLLQAKDALERIYNPGNARMQYNSLGLTMLGDSDEHDEHTSQQHRVKWLADAERVGGVGIEAWRTWWSGNGVVQELTCLALRSALSTQATINTLPRDFMMIRGVAEANLICPQLPPEICTGQWLSCGNSAAGTNVFAMDLLTPSLSWALARELPAESRQKWERVYSSRYNGLSWNTFRKAVERRGSLILLVREKVEMKGQSAAVLGAYIDSELERSPSWHGTSQNLLFSVCYGEHGQTQPLGVTVYRTSGFNDHYQYLNYSTKTLPNGLGIGGQMGHFGLWIDSGFTRGGSNTAATFSSPRLSTCDEFDIDMVEVWLVQPSQRQDDGPGGIQKSVVEANPEAAAMLEMANRPMYSSNLPQHRVDDTDEQ
ncbi:TLD domain-containing protein 1 [Coemansia guatemalensis]|uniref:Oxidation resistance protein 1 n=1 Tax=Coemansia guatemalensis TaxID=2761395 RepID=A0A9W8HVF0_9FUNG|nr:TLD domain-containing protein 1 [Coemansia guatemalensis]